MRGTFLLALCAAVTVTACRKDPAATVQKVATTADSADQVIFGMGMVLTDRGVQRAELKADTAYLFDESTRAELREINTTFFNKEGARDGTLTARRGTYNMRANVMEARQNVVILGVDGKRLTSPMVRFEQFRNVIVSDSPFVLVEGDRRLEGVGFESDPQMLNVKIRKLSRGVGASIMLPASRAKAPVLRSDSAPAPTPVPATTAPVVVPAGTRIKP